MAQKIIVWGLFDDGAMSYYNALKDDPELEVHSIGIKEHADLPNYHKIDLRLSNFELIKQLKKLPKPDVILASPPCESWSRADCSLAIWKDISETSWELNNYEFYKTVETTKNKKRNFYQKEQDRVIGEDTIGAVALIVRTFEPWVFVIENPEQSRAWKFLKYHHDFHGHKNKTYYSNYDETFSLKPTIFYSNIILKLQRERMRGGGPSTLSLWQLWTTLSNTCAINTRYNCTN